jgi:3,4-dihydroxy 2-butanone 4-phosphate synthase/GTP cyclohydrolase II
VVLSVNDIPSHRGVLERVDNAVAALARGECIVLVDDRIEQGTIVYAAAAADVDKTAFAIRHSSGFLCVALPESDCGRLNLAEMPGATSEDVTSMVVTVDAETCATTGISAADRATTVRALADPKSSATDFTRPGHVVPVRVSTDRRARQYSLPLAAFVLSEMSGQHGAAYAELVSIENPVGMAGRDELVQFAAANDLRWVTVGDLVTCLHLRDADLVAGQLRRINTAHGTFEVIDFHDRTTGCTHSVLTAGSGTDAAALPVRIHHGCDAGENFASITCDCADSLHAALARMGTEQSGSLIYLRDSHAHVASDSATELAPSDSIVARIVRRLALISFDSTGRARLDRLSTTQSLSRRSDLLDGESGVLAVHGIVDANEPNSGEGCPAVVPLGSSLELDDDLVGVWSGWLDRQDGTRHLAVISIEDSDRADSDSAAITVNLAEVSVELASEFVTVWLCQKLSESKSTTTLNADIHATRLWARSTTTLIQEMDLLSAVPHVAS